MQSVLYIAAYDVCDAKRLRRVHTLIKDYAVGGQKSAYECYLTPVQHSQLLRECQLIIAPADQFLLIRVRPALVHTLGVALPPASEFGYLG